MLKVSLIAPLVAALWLVISALVWRSIPLAQHWSRRLTIGGSLIGAFLILMLGDLIAHYFRVTQTLNVTPEGWERASDSGKIIEPELIVAIQADNTITVAGQLTSLENLGPVLVARLKALPEKTVVTFSAEPKASYSTTKAVLDACEKFGIKNMTFVVPDDDDESGK